jgi:hypothetical protein
MKKRAASVSFAVLLVATLGGVGAKDRRPSRPREVRCPAPTRSAEGNLHAGREKLYLSWLVETGEQNHALQVSILREGKWSDVRTIAEGERFFANWADFPSVIELADGSCAAHWLWRSGSGRYAYDVKIARSSDGSTWGRAQCPHRDGTQTEHGFVSLVVDASSGLSAVWLDGRAFAGKEEGDPSAEMRLMWTQFSSEGPEAETLLDARVCDCCQTAAVPTRGGVLVAYRDRSAEELRDISLMRREASGWTKPYALAADGWKIAGCPVNGPALDAMDERVAAAWFTMRGDEPVVQVAFSTDEGATFSEPSRIDEGQPLGRVDIVLLPAGEALVVWMETTSAGEASILARRVGTGGMDASFLVAESSAERSSGFPRVARMRETLYFAWTDTGEPPQVRMAELDLPRSWRK